ncbi:MAG: OmpA family protein [Myxococcales bacterium]|jgi:outer membrane protein OmpA-like peptidoglycan-associated protein
MLNRLPLSCACALLATLLTTLSTPLLPTRALAQDEGFSLGRFDPAEHGSDWFAGESLDLRGHVRPAVGLTLDWAHEPLVIYDANGDALAPVVEDQLLAHVGGGVILWDRVRFALNLPVQLTQTGEAGTAGGVTLSSSGDTTIGDLRLGGDVRILGEYGDVATLAGGVQIHLPTGDRAAYTGDGAVRITPRVMLAGDIATFAYSARMGLNYRAQDEGLGDVETGSELSFVATAGVRVLGRKLLLGPELWGTTVLSDPFTEATTPFELIFGGHYRAGDFIAALGAGPGLTRGLGAPGVRVLASVEWFPQVREPIEEPVEPEPDRDGDGIFDDQDACPDTPGVASDDPDRHGCPPPGDRDGDGIADDEDACPDTPGVASDDPSQHGCPADRDGDGIADDEDACPNTPGVRSSDPDENGCPGDRDGDGIRDPDDACPDEAGEVNADPDKHGCPIARVEEKQIKILERIEFETDKAKIRSVSEPVMQAVLSVLQQHDEITLIAIEGHTDNRGKAAYNKQLSQRRAQAVRQWLIDHGIAARRMRAEGFGMERPIESNYTDEGRQANRRVEFHIVEIDGKPAPDGDGEEE